MKRITFIFLIQLTILLIIFFAIEGFHIESLSWSHYIIIFNIIILPLLHSESLRQTISRGYKK